MLKVTVPPTTSVALNSVTSGVEPDAPSPLTLTLLYILACSAIAAAMLPAQTPSDGLELDPTTTFTFGVPFSLNKSDLVNSNAPAETIGAKAEPTRAAPAPTAASFFILSPFIFCFTSQIK